MLFKLYHNAKIVGKSWRLIMSWYSGLEEYVFYQGARSRQYTILQGVRQGRVLSPWLFLLFIDDLIKELQMLSTGIVIHNLHTGSPMFADDLTFMSRLKRSLDSMLAQAHQYSLRWRLAFNERKTVVSTFGRRKVVDHQRTENGQLVAKKLRKSLFGLILEKIGIQMLIVLYQLWKQPSPVRLLV